MPQAPLDIFIARWSESAAAERANKDLFLTELCDVLGVERPEPSTGEGDRDQYVFEKGALLLKDGQRTTTGHVDLYKAGCFVLEAKQGSREGRTRIGTARRGTGAWSNAMQEAYGQALQYARSLDDPPPFIIVCDIGHCFDLYATFDGSLDYRPFPDPRRSRLSLADLAQHLDTLRSIFQDPKHLDPSKHAATVTRQIAGHLAELARGLEAEGHDPELSARFLMRCLFTMFAEDARLLPERVFTNELEKRWIKEPAKFVAGCESLGRAMEAGNDFGYLGKLLRFNGGLFEDPTALPLSKADLELLLEAARASWVNVEPAIFGTLLERALDPRERHRLGAHTPPATMSSAW
jgi:restriction-modification enzyme MmeI-like protein